MSLRVDDGRSGGRARSRTRDRSRSRVREEPEKSKVSFVSRPSDYESETRTTRSTKEITSSSRRDASDDHFGVEGQSYEVRGPSTKVTPGLSSYSTTSRQAKDNEDDDDEAELSEDGWPSRRSRARFSKADDANGSDYSHRHHDTIKHTAKDFEDDDALDDPSYFKRAKRQSVNYPTTAPPQTKPVSSVQYPNADQRSSHDLISMPDIPGLDDDERIGLIKRNGTSTSAYKQYAGAKIPSYEHADDEGSYGAQIREVRAPREEKRQSSGRLSIGASKYDASTPPSNRMGMLTVGGTEHHRPSAGGAPPASPLLEAYQGTYQSISPMPSPMMLAGDGHDLDEVPSLELGASSSNALVLRGRSKSDAKQKKRVTIYDGESDAEKLAGALGHSQARPGPLIDVLPDLTHDQLLKLRDEYKKRYKVQGRGVNISKHIKVKTTGNFGKVCYVTSLGRWESESYWANFWYQSHSANRELLIEALMGRTNADIREIKDSFKDKRYNDSLSKCMEKELKPDKFRTAVLLALEERRQEETDTYSVEARNRDVDTLHRALVAKEGGETAILQIVVTRSDPHLREVLKTYDRMFQSNFARDALKKSNNLVGEVIAHILNGAINRPARDALLIHHALDDIVAKNRAVELRYELLMSRLIRLHWDRTHLARVKDEYKTKYKRDVERDILDATKGDFGDFCVRLCET